MYVSKYISKYISKVIIFYYIYTKYFSQRIIKKKYDLNAMYYNLYNKKETPPKIIEPLKEIYLLNEIKKNIILDSTRNYFSYKIESKHNYYYNIKCKLFASNVNNIKLVIDNTFKKIVYDMRNIDNMSKDNIDEFEFMLANNYFNLNNVYIYLLFYGDNIEIKEISFKVIDNEGINKKYPIVIFNINSKYIPIYFNVNNILNVENKEIDRSNNFFK